MSKSDTFASGNFSQHMLTSMLYTTLKLDDAPALWLDATAVKEAVERLGDVHVDHFRPLDEVKEQLAVNPARHMEFLEFGGANGLWDLLKNGNSVMQRKCLRAIEVLATNDAPRKHLREMGIGDTLLEIIRASSKRPESNRRAKAGVILKRLAGSSSSAVSFNSPQIQVPKKRKPSRRRARKKSLSVANFQYSTDAARERPLPYWYFTTNPILPWDAETVASLVDILLSDAVEESQDCAHRIIRKILYIGQLTRHVVIDPADISDLISIIRSMHSTTIHAVRAVTFASIMHTSNGVTFIQRNGIEALVSSLKSDNMGSVCGEVSAWALAHFCKTSGDGALRIIEAGGSEALVELSHSTDTCSREAAMHAIVSLLKNCDKQKKLVLKRMCESDIIPSLLNILQEHNDSRKGVILYDALWTLLQMARHAIYRTEICDLDGIVIVQRSLMGAERPVTEMGRRLQRVLSTRSQRISLVWKSSNKKGKSFRSRIVHKLKKIFRTETNISPQTNGGSSQPQSSLGQSRSMPAECRRPIPERSISSLSSSVHSECCDVYDGLLATAPEGPTGMTLAELFANSSSPKFKTFSAQPYGNSNYDKDFDPFIFGGRPIPLTKVVEKNCVWSSGDSENDDSGETYDPEIITTHDFL